MTPPTAPGQPEPQDPPDRAPLPNQPVLRQDIARALGKAEQAAQVFGRELGAAFDLMIGLLNHEIDIRDERISELEQELGRVRRRV